MPGKPRGKQLPLGLDESTADRVAICRGVFSLPYIRGHFIASDDFYEGLLGAQLAENISGRLELRNQNGENHRQGIPAARNR